MYPRVSKTQQDSGRGCGRIRLIPRSRGGR